MTSLESKNSSLSSSLASEKRDRAMDMCNLSFSPHLTTPQETTTNSPLPTAPRTDQWHGTVMYGVQPDLVDLAVAAGGGGEGSRGSRSPLCSACSLPNPPDEDTTSSDMTMPNLCIHQLKVHMFYVRFTCWKVYWSLLSYGFGPTSKFPPRYRESAKQVTYLIQSKYDLGCGLCNYVVA